MKRHITNAFFIILFILLCYAVYEMPIDHTTDAPSYNEVVNHYIEQGLNDTGATNIVAAIMTDYRGFDTLGETIVLFSSIVAAASVLRPSKKKEEVDEHGR